MQTFLPYPSFIESAKVLDWRRLGKQRVETKQIINALLNKPRKDGKPATGWKNHPCSVMWRDYIPALKFYHDIMILEWINRGYKNTMKLYGNIPEEFPKWLGNKDFHASHRSNLLRKDKVHYSQFNWRESNDLPYMWLDKNNKWFELHSGTKNKIYKED